MNNLAQDNPMLDRDVTVFFGAMLASMTVNQGALTVRQQQQFAVAPPQFSCLAPKLIGPLEIWPAPRAPVLNPFSRSSC